MCCVLQAYACVHAHPHTSYGTFCVLCAMCCVLCAVCVLCILCSMLCALCSVLSHTCTYRPCASTANSSAPAKQNSKMLSISVLQAIRTCMHTSYVSHHTKSSGALLICSTCNPKLAEVHYIRVLAHNRVQVPANSSAPEQRSAEALHIAVLQAITCQKYCVLQVKQSGAPIRTPIW